MERWLLSFFILGCASAPRDVQPELADPVGGSTQSTPSTSSTSEVTSIATVALRGPTTVHDGDESVPVYGGTIARGTDTVIIAQPDQDQIHKWDQGSERLTWRTALAPGSEPFRVALAVDEDTVYVTLRGTGEVIALDVDTGNEAARSLACPEPRGISVTDEVMVACASGELVTLSLDLEPTQSYWIAEDLRDVVVNKGTTWVSRFRRADVGRVDLVEGTVHWFRPDAIPQTTSTTGEARGAWRMRPLLDGGVMWVHQAHTDRVVGETPKGEPLPREFPYYGSPDLCDASLVVTSHVSWVDAQGALHTSGPLGGVVLPVDFDIRGQDIQVVGAGVQDAYRAIVHLRQDRLDPDRCAQADLKQSVHVSAGTATSVALHPSLPDRDLNVGVTTNPAAVHYGWGQAVPLPERTETVSRGDAFDDFHHDVGAQITCASCHLEGGDDGHVWAFTEIGLRRTQNLAGGVSQRAPFHWDSEFEDFTDLMKEVFEFRMQGPTIASPRADDLAGWIDQVDPVETSPTESTLVERGRQLFDDAIVACTSCHSGPDFSDHQMVQVRADDEPRKTPSLRGVGNRAPYMSDGCAETLMQRFTDPECGGGDMHGKTSQLSEQDVRALVAYLRTL